MTLRHLGGDRWEVRVYDRTRGERRSRSFRADGIRAAKAAAATVETELRAAIAKDAAGVGTVADITRRWLRGPTAAKWSPTTRRGYECIAAVIVRDLGAKRADRLRVADVDDWLMRLADGRSPRTVNHHRAVLRAIFREAERRELIPSARAITASTPPTVRRHELALPPEDVVRLLLTTASPTLACAAIIAAHAGLRRGEVVGLQWADLEGDTLHVRRAVVHDGPGLTVKTPKSGKGRTVTLSAGTLAALAAHMGRVPGSPWVFGDPFHPDRPRRPDWLTLAWRRHCARQGAVGFRFHDLRHWHATALLNAGVPLQVASARLGHSSPVVTLGIYAHSSDAADRAAVQAVGDLLALPPPPT